MQSLPVIASSSLPLRDSLLTNALDLLKHNIDPPIHIVIDPTNERNPIRLDEPLPHGIAFLLMPEPIDFDGELRLRAVEINNIRTNTVLPPKTQPVQLLSAQSRPKDDLCTGHVIAQASPERFLLLTVEDSGHAFLTFKP